MSRPKHDDAFLPDDAIVWVEIDGEAPRPTTWADFSRDNPDDALLYDVARALHARREYRGGGGAAPTYVVRWYPVPA